MPLAEKGDSFFSLMSPQKCKLFRVEENYASLGPETVAAETIEIRPYDIYDCCGFSALPGDPLRLLVYIDPRSVIIVPKNEFVGEAGLLPQAKNDDLKPISKFPTLSNEFFSDEG